MKQKLFFFLIAVLVVNFRPLLWAQIHFTAAMDGTQEVPQVTTSATGTGSFELSEDFTKLTYFVSYQGMSSGGVAGNFFVGKAGVNGTAVGSLTSPTTSSGTFSGVWRSTDSEPFTEALAESLLAGKVYMSFRDGTFATGEIRGQLALGTSLHFEVNCDGSQEVPPVSENGGGTGVFVLDPTRTELDYWITCQGLSGPLTAGGEISSGSIGSSGLVVKNIGLIGAPASAALKGSWKTTDSQPLTPALVDSMIAGKMYLNFRTAAHGEGEIRGQLVLKGGIGFIASIDGSQETPPTMTNASATASFILNDAHNSVTYHVTYFGPSGTVGMIHSGSSGENGASVKTLIASGSADAATIAGIWTPSDPKEEFTPSVADLLLTGQLYIELGTAAGSAIRGQLNLTTGIGLTAQLSAKQDVPPTVVSDGTGTSSVVLSPDRQSVSYSLTFLNLTGNISPSGGHFHVGPKGVNGTLVKIIVPPNMWGAGSVNGVWQASDGGPELLTPAIAEAFATEDVYINLHTGGYIGGEIRGQVSYSFDLLSSAATSPSKSVMKFDLEQNYPNPFNPSTQIEFSIPQQEHVVLQVYDVLGRVSETLIDGVLNGGSHTVAWKPNGKKSGVYFCRLQTERSTSTRKLLYLK